MDGVVQAARGAIARRCAALRPEHALGAVGATRYVVGSALCVRFRDSARGARRAAHSGRFRIL